MAEALEPLFPVVTSQVDWVLLPRHFTMCDGVLYILWEAGAGCFWSDLLCGLAAVSAIWNSLLCRVIAPQPAARGQFFHP